MIFYSPSEKGFFHSEIHEVMPEDKIAVTAEKHAALLAAQAEGKEIVMHNGNVVARERASDLTWENIRSRRNRLITKSDWTQLPDNSLDDNAKNMWRTYRQALRDITETFADPNSVVWPASPAS